jgi:pimeloyl-ACP methyl ester carboxylesterase
MPKAPVNGISLYYEVHGQGEPLILIQGLAGPCRAWYFQTRAFKKHYQVIVFDNRGIGKTDKSPEPYSAKTMADDTLGLMDHLGIDRAHVLGMSLGSLVAQELAIHYPQRVNKLILAMATTGRQDRSDVHLDLLRALGAEDGATDVDIRSVDFSKVMREVVSLAFNKRLYRMVQVPLAKFLMKRTNVDGYLAQMEAITADSPLDRVHLVQAPTLVLTGAGDRLVSPSQSELLASRIPNAKLVKVEGASHAFFLEMRSRFNEEVLGFLREPQ